MSKSKLLCLLTILLMPAVFTACEEDADITEPSFSGISIIPEKDVYKVGDVITCSITRTSPGAGDLRKSSYWWYASTWFADPEMKADFEDFGPSDTNTSEPITLTEPGELTLYFFGRLEYPDWDWRKVEISRTIRVTE